VEATLINVFVVPEEKEEEFLERWQATSKVFQSSGWLLEAHLHRNTDAGNTTFRFVNVARWASAEAWRLAHENHPPSEYEIEGVIGHPSIFEPVYDVYSDTMTEVRARTHWLAANHP
jgi:heme-degrading monooxygenase HmoA